MTAYNLYFFLLPFETTFNEIAAGTEVKTVNNNARTSGFRNMQYSLLIATGETRKIRGRHCGGLACQCYYFSFFFLCYFLAGSLHLVCVSVWKKRDN